MNSPATKNSVWPFVYKIYVSKKAVLLQIYISVKKKTAFLRYRFFTHILYIYIYIYIHTYIYTRSTQNTCILGRTHFVERSIHLIDEHWVLTITGVQASEVIIDRLLRQCCFVWSEIVGPHSSGNFNDWPLKLKAGSKYSDALRDSI